MAGELITGDWQFEYRGVLFSKDEGYRVSSVDGLDTMPAIRRGKVDRPRSDGSLVLPQYADERVITIEMSVRGATHEECRARVDAAAAVFSKTSSPAEFVWKLPGIDARSSMCRAEKRSIPTDQMLRVKNASLTAQLIAEDPLVYSATQQSDSTGIGSTVGAMSFPLVFPLVFGTATPGTITAVNDGSADAPWTATLTGPISSPRIVHVGQQRALEFAGFSLAAGETLTFDSQLRTVLLGGTASRSNALTRREWFDLEPGSNVILLDASSGTGQLTMTWRSAWL